MAARGEPDGMPLQGVASHGKSWSCQQTGAASLGKPWPWQAVAVSKSRDKPWSQSWKPMANRDKPRQAVASRGEAWEKTGASRGEPWQAVVRRGKIPVQASRGKPWQAVANRGGSWQAVASAAK